jgi:hypothetical protein
MRIKEGRNSGCCQEAGPEIDVALQLLLRDAVVPGDGPQQILCVGGIWRTAECVKAAFWESWAASTRRDKSDRLKEPAVPITVDCTPFERQPVFRWQGPWTWVSTGSGVLLNPKRKTLSARKRRGLGRELG